MLFRQVPNGMAGKRERQPNDSRGGIELRFL